jgi:hypothetical protein
MKRATLDARVPSDRLEYHAVDHSHARPWHEESADIRAVSVQRVRLEPAHFIMQRGMLRGIRDRAEASGNQAAIASFERVVRVAARSRSD